MKIFKTFFLILFLNPFCQSETFFNTTFDVNGIYPTSFEVDHEEAIRGAIVAGVTTGLVSTIYLGVTGNCTAATILGIGLASAAAAAWPIAKTFYKYHRLNAFVALIQEDLAIRENIARLNEREPFVHHVARELRLPANAHGLIRSIYLAKKMLVESYLDKTKWLDREAKLQLINQLNVNLAELEKLLFEHTLKQPRLFYEQPLQEKMFDEWVWSAWN